MFSVPTQSLKTLRRTAAVSVFPVLIAGSAFAQGMNTTVPAVPQPTPPATILSTTQVTGGAACAQQLDNHGVSLAQTSQNVAIAQTTADGLGLAAEVIGEAGQPFTNPATVAGVAAQIVALGLGVADLVNQQAQIDLTNTINNLPNCDSVFVGTVRVDAGGTDVTGNSIYQNNLAVVQNLDVGGDISASKIRTTQGISTNGGGITIGDPNLETFSSGITLGGGALSGAGFGGLQAFTGDVSAVAIGNGARATAVNSLALGRGAIATDNSATAIGNDARATLANSAAFGNGARVTRTNQQVFGTATNTYTMPGITSEASRNAQAGLLEVTTTDAAGNLATDGGDIFNAISTVQAGVAVAMAMETPELATGENFGFRIGWGGFDSFKSEANAMGLAAIGVVGRNLFGGVNRLALDIGAGMGWSEFKGYRQDEVLAGRAGAQFTW